MSQKIKKLFLLCVLLAPLIANALQLGKIVVTSSQGQPLNAEIEMMLTPGEDLSKLKTSLASKENYESQGIERLAIHNTISVELQKNEKGLTVLKLKSSQPVPDPFLDLLIQVDSAKGRNYREYTVLLDPPETPIIQYFEGEHDFSAFRSSECQAKSPVRTMSRISLTNYHPFYLFKFSANGFLHHQIRNMMGAILYIGKGNYPSNYIEELLLSKDRTKSPPTFLPDGLYLSGVDYDARYAFPFMHRTVNIFDNNHLCQDR